MVRRTKHGQGRDGKTRDNFLYETDSPSRLTASFSFDVKAKIDLLEIDMKRNRHTQNTRIEKHETNEADETFAVLQVKLSTGGNARSQQRRVDLVIRHYQVLPSCC